MRKSILLILAVLAFIAFLGSRPSSSVNEIAHRMLTEKGTEKESKQQDEDTSGTYIIKQSDGFSAFPFNKALRIEVLSYPNRSIWDTIQNSNSRYLNYNIIENGVVRLNTSKIRDRIELTQEQSDTLQHILYNVRCDFREIEPCFNPRYSVIFYDHTDAAFAALEISSDCLTYNTSGEFSYIDYCTEKNKELISFFKEIGIRYYITDIENDKLYEWRLAVTGEMMNSHNN